MNAAQLNALRHNSSQAKEFEALLCELQKTRVITNFVRIMKTTHATKNDAQTGKVSARLSTGTGPSRFSSVNTGKTKKPRFRVLYGAANLQTACCETIIRNRLDFTTNRILKLADYNRKCAVNISTKANQMVSVLDLSYGNGIRSGVPTDVILYSNHRSGQHFSEFVHRQMPYIDGFLYSSRFTNGLCVAIYERAVHKLISSKKPHVLSESILKPALDNLNISVI